MTAVDAKPLDTEELTSFLAGCPPFDSLEPAALDKVSRAAGIEHFDRGELILDAFTQHSVDTFVVVSGQVELWNTINHIGGPADETVEPHGLFGFSAMLTERSIGPRAIAAGPVTVARIPGPVVAPAFSSRRGARFLAEMVSAADRRVATAGPTYTLVDELIVRQPLVVEPSMPAGEVARLMSEHHAPYAAVPRGDEHFGLITDTVLREQILVLGRPPSVPAAEIMDPATTVLAGDSAAEALILMLDREVEFLLVVDRAGGLRGGIAPRDFAISSTTADVSLHEQLRRADSIAELTTRARRVPAMLGDLLSRGLTSDRVIAVYSATLDTIVRRAIGLTFADHSELSVDDFTWLSLGSNGRREAVPSSDVDSAVAFDNDVAPALVAGYRAAFAEVSQVLAQAGLSSDEHGATAQREPFSRTNLEWQAAARQWLAAPAEHQGAVMTSLLVDGRPIHGDPGLPAVSKVFSDLRRHRGTMRLLLQESLAIRARLRSTRNVLTRRASTFDIKDHALLPIVNIGRWAALSVGSSALPTTERLRVAAGSAMLPDEQARTLIEVFGVLQRLRLRYQLLQVQAGDAPTDVLVMDEVSPIDRSVIAQAVREISAAQRRMDNVAHYVDAEGWVAPEPG